MIKNFTRLIFVLSIIFISTIPVFAQGPDPGCDPLDPSCPIDGGISLLIAVGIGLGAKKTFKNNHSR